MGKKIQSVGDYILRGVTLGKGKMARVELAVHKDIDAKVALKVVDTAKLPEQVLLSNEYTKEARILTQLRHPNIVRLYETLRAKTYYSMVLEYISGGDLRAYIKSFADADSRPTEGSVRPYVRQLVSALHYLHERNLVHRNLNTSNVLLDSGRKFLKLIDFGLCDVISAEQAPNSVCGMLDFVAPEMMTGTKYTFEVDIWSLGVIVYNMLVGEVPFFTMPGSLANKKNRALIAKRQLNTNHKRQMAHLSESGQQLITTMLENSPSLRCTISDIETHAWLTEDGKKPFVPYQSTRYDSGIKRSVINTLTQEHGVDAEQIESYLAEKRSNRVTTMYFLLLDEAKREKGLHEVDHTLGPSLSSPTSSANLQNNQNALCRCGNHANVGNDPSKFVCPLDCLNFERSVSMCVDFSQSPSSPSQSSLNKQRWGSMRKSLQKGNRILNEYLEKRCTDNSEPPKTPTPQTNGNGEEKKDELFVDRPFSISHNSLWQLTRNSPLVLSPDIQRKFKKVQCFTPNNGKMDDGNMFSATELTTFRDFGTSSTESECAALQEVRQTAAERSTLMKTSRTSYFERSMASCTASMPQTPIRGILVAPKAALDDIDETLGHTAANSPQCAADGPSGLLAEAYNHVGDSA